MDPVNQALDELRVGCFSYFRFHAEMACCYIPSEETPRFVRLLRRIHAYKAPERLRCLALAHFASVCVHTHERDDAALREHLIGMFDSADAMDY
jgi:hypothetical protein